MKSQTRGFIGLVVIIATIFVILLPPDPTLHMPPLPPHIRNIAWIVLLVSGLVLIFFYMQPREKHPEPQAIPDDKVSGRILEYQTNRIGDIDKLVISGDQKSVINFPPHTAKSVMKAAPKNEIAELSVKPVAKHGMFELKSVISSSPMLELASLPPQLAATGKKIEISGKAGKYKLDEKGIVAGIIIEKYLVDLPQGLVKNILPVLKDSVEIKIRGYERSSGEGFVNVTGLTIIKPYAISIDKTDYLL